MRMTWGTNTIDFFYDASGLPYAMKYNGTVYYYITTLQGDVMRIVDASQNIVTSYDYDPAEVNALANKNLAIEISYKNGEIVSYGTKGSIRFDVLQYNQKGVPIAAWDFKTGSATLTTTRIEQMQTRSGLNISIYVVK